MNARAVSAEQDKRVEGGCVCRVCAVCHSGGSKGGTKGARTV